MTDSDARKLIASSGLKGPVARAVAHILRRYKDAEGTMKALKAIIEALKVELSALVPDEKAKAALDGARKAGG